MTWDQLIGKIRENLGESSAHLRTVGTLLAEADEAGSALNEEQIRIVLAILVLGVSNIHSAVEHAAIGLDAVVEAFRDQDNPQEVDSDGNRRMS